MSGSRPVSWRAAGTQTACAGELPTSPDPRPLLLPRPSRPPHHEPRLSRRPPQQFVCDKPVSIWRHLVENLVHDVLEDVSSQSRLIAANLACTYFRPCPAHRHCPTG